MTYAERDEAARQEQLDWLHELHEQAKAQTALLAQIRQHTGLLYGVALVFVVLMGLGLLGWLASLFGA